METQVQQMRQDLMTEIHRLQNMFSAKQLAGSNSREMEKSIAKDLKDMYNSLFQHYVTLIFKTMFCNIFSQIGVQAFLLSDYFHLLGIVVDDGGSSLWW